MWLLNDDAWLQRGKEGGGEGGGGQESEKKWLHNKWMLPKHVIYKLLSN